MGLCRTVSEINGDFGRKSQFFLTHVFCAPAEGVPPWNWVSAPRVKKLEWLGYRAEQEVWRYLQPYVDTIHQRDRQTDRRSDIGRQQRPRLRIASHGKDHGNLNPRQKKTAHCLPVRTDRTHTTSTNITIFRFVSLAYFVFSRDYASFGWVLRSVSKRPRIAGSGQSRNWPTLTKLSWDCATAHI